MTQNATTITVTKIPAKALWQLELAAGLISLIMGLILALHPSGSFKVVAVLIGVAIVFGGIFNFIRALDHEEQHRVFMVVAGLVEVIVGVVMIRHLDLTKAVVGLLIGISWIIQGIVVLLGAAAGAVRGHRGWAIVFGLISLAAGIVVVMVPSHSVNALATLLGIWLMVLGIMELIGGFLFRAELAKAS